MDTCNPPPADSVIAADLYYGWLARAGDGELELIRALHATKEQNDVQH